MRNCLLIISVKFKYLFVLNIFGDNMVIVHVPKSKFQIFKKRPKSGKKTSSTKSVNYFTYTTNNPKNKRGVVAKKGVQLRYG